MTEVRFYHLTRTGLERALPDLLGRTLERGWRAVVMAGSAERVGQLNQHLWTYDPGSFLPHGTAEDGAPETQPIFLTDRDERPNGAGVLFLTDGADSRRIGDYDLVCLLFDGREEAAVATARERWQRYREAGHALAYWQQGDDGRWREARRVEGASAEADG
ncbi:MAG: DNA polymerase III subunit chi [Azospirillaceae bacterium]